MIKHGFRFFNKMDEVSMWSFRASKKQARIAKKNIDVFKNEGINVMVTKTDIVYVKLPVVKGGASYKQKKQNQRILKQVWDIIQDI